MTNEAFGGKKLIKPWKPYTITEALTLVKTAALEGRKLEAWCVDDPNLFYRISNGIWIQHIIGPNGTTDRTDLTFWVYEVLGIWHVREVKD